MRTTSLLILAVSFLAGPAIAGEATRLNQAPDAAKKLLDLPDVSQAEYAQVEGTWELVQDTNLANNLRRVKTHRAGKTTVTAYDAEGNIVGQHSSQYKLKKSGMARVFVYFNVIPATGPSKGRELPGPFYYAYSIHGNTFVEANGLLAGDERSPRIIFWNRVKK